MGSTVKQVSVFGLQIAVQAINIIGTDLVVLSAWVPTKAMGPYGTISTLGLGGGFWGRMGTARGSDAGGEALYVKRAIRTAFPGLALDGWSDSECALQVTVAEFQAATRRGC